MKPVQGYYALSAQSDLGPGVQSLPKQEVAGEMTRSTIWSHDLSLLFFENFYLDVVLIKLEMVQFSMYKTI